MLFGRRWFHTALLAAIVTLASAGPQAASAADRVVSGLSWQIGPFRLDIPRMEVFGTALGETELRAILTTMPATGPLSGALARLEAERVVIPEARMTQASGIGAQTIVYSDIVLGGVRSGVIGTMAVGATTGAVTDPQAGEVRYTVGKASGEAIDLPQIARTLTERAAPAGEPLKPLFAALTYNDYRIRLPNDAGEVTVARVVNRDARARPGAEPLTTLLAEIMALPQDGQNRSNNSTDGGGSSGQPSAEELRTIARALRLFDHFQYGVVDVEGVEARFNDGTQSGRIAMRQARFSDVDGQSGFAMAGLLAEGGGARIALAEFEARDFAFAPAIAALAEMIEAGDLDAVTDQLGRLIPKLGTLRLKGFEVEAPEALTGRRTRGTPQMLRAAISGAEIAVGAQREGVPTAIRFSVDGLDVPLPANSTDTGVRDLRAMGLTSLNLSWLADLAWRESDNALDIRSLSISGRDLVTASLTGELANVTADAFSLDTALAPVAWLGATARRATLSIENRGLFEKVLANEARKAGKSPDTLRRELGAAAAVGLPTLLGASDGARTLTNALARFVARPGRLDVDIASRNPAGLGVADVMASLERPQALFERLEVKAAAR
jgi:hypothetical protein